MFVANNEGDVAIGVGGGIKTEIGECGGGGGMDTEGGGDGGQELQVRGKVVSFNRGAGFLKFELDGKEEVCLFRPNRLVFHGVKVPAGRLKTLEGVAQVGIFIFFVKGPKICIRSLNEYHTIDTYVLLYSVFFLLELF